jgi:pre-mRNA-processing factor 17
MSFFNLFATESSDDGQIGTNEDNKVLESTSFLNKPINIAPSTSKLQIHQYESPESTVANYNAPADAMWAPVQGPYHPVLSKKSPYSVTNTPNGFVEPHFVHDADFHEQFHSFQAKGWAINPNNTGIVGTYNPTNKTPTKRKRLPAGDPADLSEDGYKGPWAPFEDEAKLEEELKKTGERILTEEEKEFLEEAKKPKTEEKEVLEAKSIYHLKEDRDYLGRSFIDPPSHLKNIEHECFLPKKKIHTWAGHNQGVSAIRFFPTYVTLQLFPSIIRIVYLQNLTISFI